MRARVRVCTYMGHMGHRVTTLESSLYGDPALSAKWDTGSRAPHENRDSRAILMSRRVAGIIGGGGAGGGSKSLGVSDAATARQPEKRRVGNFEPQNRGDDA